MGKMTEEQIAKEDHDNGECGTGCKWCHEKHMEVVNALYPPTPGFWVSHYFMGCTFKA
jgi:hypothetical protein